MKKLLLVMLCVIPFAFAGHHEKGENKIAFTIDLEIAEGKAEDFAKLVRKMVVSVKASEPGTHSYHYFSSPDGSMVTLLEVYPSNAAALAHMAAFSESPFREEFLSLITVKSFQVVGNANAELKEVMAPYTTDVRKPLAGFSR